MLTPSSCGETIPSAKKSFQYFTFITRDGKQYFSPQTILKPLSNINLNP